MQLPRNLYIYLTAADKMQPGWIAHLLRRHVEADADTGERNWQIRGLVGKQRVAEALTVNGQIGAGCVTLTRFLTGCIDHSVGADRWLRPNDAIEINTEVLVRSHACKELLLAGLVAGHCSGVADSELVCRLAFRLDCSATLDGLKGYVCVRDRRTIAVCNFEKGLSHTGNRFEIVALKGGYAERHIVPDDKQIRNSQRNGRIANDNVTLINTGSGARAGKRSRDRCIGGAGVAGIVRVLGLSWTVALLDRDDAGMTASEMPAVVTPILQKFSPTGLAVMVPGLDSTPKEIVDGETVMFVESAAVASSFPAP